MKLVKTFSIVAALFIFWSSVRSQNNNSSVHFDSNQHNFGIINESEGAVRHDFLFTNTGTDPLVITNVRAGRGVSVLQFTRSPVMPGDSGAITLEFNPVNMPGRFNRNIIVSATGNPSSASLRLLGEVIPREKTPEELYPREIGLLRLRSNHISFGNLSPGSVKTDSLQVINLSDRDLDISFSGIPGNLTVEAVPRILKPGDKGVLRATWDGGQTDEWGVITRHFRVVVNGEARGSNIIYSSANIQEDFSGMSKQEMLDAPSIEFDSRVFDFGKIVHGESIEHDFVFTNTGRSDLIIRRVRAGCGCTAIEPLKTLLKPGESSAIKAVFSSRGFRGKQNKGISVISNDPSSPHIVLRITGEVIAE